MLDRGRIVERGNHASLLKANGPYSRLYDLQLREQEEFEARMLDISDVSETGDAASYANGQREVLR